MQFTLFGLGDVSCGKELIEKVKDKFKQEIDWQSGEVVLFLKAISQLVIEESSCHLFTLCKSTGLNPVVKILSKEEYEKQFVKEDFTSSLKSEILFQKFRHSIIQIPITASEETRRLFHSITRLYYQLSQKSTENKELIMFPRYIQPISSESREDITHTIRIILCNYKEEGPFNYTIVFKSNDSVKKLYQIIERKMKRIFNDFDMDLFILKCSKEDSYIYGNELISQFLYFQKFPNCKYIFKLFLLPVKDILDYYNNSISLFPQLECNLVRLLAECDDQEEIPSHTEEDLVAEEYFIEFISLHQDNINLERNPNIMYYIDFSLLFGNNIIASSCSSFVSSLEDLKNIRLLLKGIHLNSISFGSVFRINVIERTLPPNIYIADEPINEILFHWSAPCFNFTGEIKCGIHEIKLSDDTNQEDVQFLEESTFATINFFKNTCYKTPLEDKDYPILDEISPFDEINLLEKVFSEELTRDNINNCRILLSRKMQIYSSLSLLTPSNPDIHIRKSAVESLKSISDIELSDIIPYLVETLKYELYLNSQLLEFLLERAWSSPFIGNSFVISCFKQMGIRKSVKIGLALECYLRGCHPFILNQYYLQRNNLEQFQNIHLKLLHEPPNYTKQEEILETIHSRISFPISLPLIDSFLISNIDKFNVNHLICRNSELHEKESYRFQMDNANNFHILEISIQFISVLLENRYKKYLNVDYFILNSRYVAIQNTNSLTLQEINKFSGRSSFFNTPNLSKFLKQQASSLEQYDLIMDNLASSFTIVMVLSILFDIKLDDSKLSITKDGILFISQCPDIFLRGSILRVPVIQREIDPIYSPISVIHTLGGFASKNMEKVFKNINKTYNILYDLRVVIEPVFQMLYESVHSKKPTSPVIEFIPKDECKRVICRILKAENGRNFRSPGLLPHILVH